MEVSKIRRPYASFISPTGKKGERRRGGRKKEKEIPHAFPSKSLEFPRSEGGKKRGKKRGEGKGKCYILNPFSERGKKGKRGEGKKKKKKG